MIVTVFVSFLYVNAFAAPIEDLVDTLPGLNFTPKFKHYSGYLNVSSTKQFFYNFVEAYEKPSTAPILLWLNGGPGCSSILGMLTELGPFRLKDGGKTVFINPYAWNHVGNIIFLESPAGVGYSYSSDGFVNATDESTASDNHAAMIDFFRKFPEYRKNSLFLTGESYAGVYIPMLAVKIAADSKNFPNFKGMAIGNGVFSFKLSYNTWLPFLYYHGLVRENRWNNLIQTCCFNQTYDCDFFKMLHSGINECHQKVSQLFASAQTGNDYNLYAACYLDDPSQQRILLSHMMKAVSISNMAKTNLPLCAQSNNDYLYMNRPDVRAALHVHPQAPVWKECSEDVDKNYNRTRFFEPMFPEFKYLLDKIRILIYNGDTDTVCNVLLSSKFAAQLNLPLVANFENQTFWYYAKETPNTAGYITRYEKNVDFLTVRGSGHMVPMDKPRETLQMIHNFVFEKDYSEPLP